MTGGPEVGGSSGGGGGVVARILSYMYTQNQHSKTLATGLLANLPAG